MAGSNLMMIGLAFVAGVLLGDKVRSLVQENLNIKIPSFYGAYSYPAAIDYPSTTRTSLAGSVYEKDYDSANELHINHLPLG